MRPLRTPLSISSKQRGAVLMVMLVIMIMGVSFLLVSALSKVTLQNARDEKSGEILAQAKEVVIGYAISGGSRPGELPLQDRLVTPIEEAGTTDGHPNYNGLQDGCSGSNFCFGRLPWRALGMSIGAPSENDPSGFMPWYAVSGNLVDTTITLNSELLNTDNVVHPPNNYPAPPHPWLTVRDMNGNVISDRVAFVIIIPGSVLPGQSRPVASIAPPVSLGGGDQYLDRIGLPPGCNPNPPTPTCPTIYSNYGANNEFISGAEHRWIADPVNPGKQIEDPYYNFNDKLIYVTIDELMPLIEKRIAREVKACLDDYAQASAGKYPWASPITDPTYTTAQNTLFGRIPASPVVLITDPSIAAPLNDLQTALNNLQSAVNACNISDNSPNPGNLANAANALLNATNGITIPPFTGSTSLTSLINASTNAGNAAIPTGFGGSTYSNPCDWIKDHASSVIESNLNNIANNNYMADIPTTSPEDTTMQPSWSTTASCSTLFTSTYWNEWKSLVLYQIADGYKPGTATPSCGGSCLSINGSGNPNNGSGSYRAAVSLAGKKIDAQSRTLPSVDQFLELNNNINKSATPSNLTFDTYKTADSNYSNVNDLVLCLDGKNYCK